MTDTPTAGPMTDPAAPPATEAFTFADTATELGALLPEPETLILSTGRHVRLRPLRTLEVFQLMQIFTAGLGATIGDLRLDPNESERVFIARFASLLIASLPERGPQIVGFLRAMVEPPGRVDGATDEATVAANAQLDAALDVEMRNPAPIDTIRLIEAIARREAPQLQALGKELVQMWQTATRSGLIPDSLTSPA